MLAVVPARARVPAPDLVRPPEPLTARLSVLVPEGALSVSPVPRKTPLPEML